MALVMLAGFVSLAETRADPYTHAEKRAAAPPVSYSPLHYWAPTPYRWMEYLHPKTVPLYAADRYPEIPNSIGVMRFPNPAVAPAAYYRGTGLSYDPLGPFMVHPPAIREQ
jgi:hypothetical protein